MAQCPPPLNTPLDMGRLFQRPIEILSRHSDCGLRIYKKLNYEIMFNSRPSFLKRR